MGQKSTIHTCSMNLMTDFFCKINKNCPIVQMALCVSCNLSAEASATEQNHSRFQGTVTLNKHFKLLEKKIRNWDKHLTQDTFQYHQSKCFEMNKLYGSFECLL